MSTNLDISKSTAPAATSFAVQVPDQRVSPEQTTEHTCEQHPDWRWQAVNGEWRFAFRRGDNEINDALMEACPACQAEDRLARRIARWEDQPLDPDEDLGWLDGEYPATELDRLREVQQSIAAHPVYRIANVIGGRVRAECLTACAWGDLEDFYVENVCECEPLEDMFADGRPVYSWHRREARCRWCVLKEALDEGVWSGLLDDAGRELAGYVRATVPPDRRAELPDHLRLALATHPAERRAA